MSFKKFVLSKNLQDEINEVLKQTKSYMPAYNQSVFPDTNKKTNQDDKTETEKPETKNESPCENCRARGKNSDKCYPNAFFKAKAGPGLNPKDAVHNCEYAKREQPK